MNFIRTTRGYFVNMDHVAAIEQFPSDPNYYRLMSADLKEITTIDFLLLDYLTGLPDFVLPPNPGQTGWQLFLCNDASPDRWPVSIIGWEVKSTAHGPERSVAHFPIFAWAIDEDEASVFLVEDRGVFTCFGGDDDPQRFTSLDAAKEKLQKDWGIIT